MCVPVMKKRGCFIKIEYVSEGIDCKNDEIWFWFGVIDNIEVNEFLEFHIFSHHISKNVSKKHRNILSSCHCIDDLSWIEDT